MKIYLLKQLTTTLTMQPVSSVKCHRHSHHLRILSHKDLLDQYKHDMNQSTEEESKTQALIDDNPN
jgi:hypothetical protein